MNRKTLLAAGEILCAVFLIGMAVWYWGIKPPVVAYTNEPFAIAHRELHAGEVQTFTVKRMASQPARIQITRGLINKATGEETDLFSTKRNIDVGASERDTDVVISMATRTGFHQICGKTHVLDVWDEWLRKDVPWCTEEFYVHGKS